MSATSTVRHEVWNRSHVLESFTKTITNAFLSCCQICHSRNFQCVGYSNFWTFTCCIFYFQICGNSAFCRFKPLHTQSFRNVKMLKFQNHRSWNGCIFGFKLLQLIMLILWCFICWIFKMIIFESVDISMIWHLQQFEHTNFWKLCS